MSNRVRIAIAATAVLGLLLLWNLQRERLVGACRQSGGVWIGAASRCELAPGRPLLQRDLQRT